MPSSPTQRRGSATRARPRRAAVLAALLVAAVGAGAVVWSWSTASPAPPATPGLTPAAVTDSRAAAGVDARTTTVEATGQAPARSEATPRTAVVGTVFGCRGVPLARTGVTLQRKDRMPVRTSSLKSQLDGPPDLLPYPSMFAQTDATGGFAFESLDPGNYRCHVSGLETQGETFALRSGEVREVALRCSSVALQGTLTRRGEVVKDCYVELDDGSRNPFAHPDATGVMRWFAAPGRYEVIVRLAPRAYENRMRSPCLSRHVLLVPDSVATLPWSFESGGTELAFAVADPHGNAVDRYRVDIEGVGALEPVAGCYVLHGTRERPAAMAALPTGRWRATVTCDSFRVEPRDFATGLADGRQVLAFVALPAARVRLQLRASSPFVAVPEPGNMPPLVVDGCAVPCRSAGAGTRAGAPSFEYTAVPPGKATLCFQDRIEGDELVTLPFEPVAPATVDVIAGGANEVMVAVVPRTYVDLRACDASGVEMPTAMLTVCVDGRRVRNREAKTTQQWLGWLPAGVYRVVVDRNGAQREHVLRVERRHVRERYRP